MRHEFPLVADVCRKRLIRIENQKEKVRATTVLERWIWMLPPDLKLSELNSGHVQLYVDARLRDVKPASVNREVTIITEQRMYVDKRLDLAQKRFLRSINTLAKVRKMIAQTQAKGAEMFKNLITKD